MNTHQDTQLNRGRCSYSPKQHTVYVVEEEEGTSPEQLAPPVDRVDAEVETGLQHNNTFNMVH